MKQSKRNKITRAVEAWRARRPPLWTLTIPWPPQPTAATYEPIWLVDYGQLPTYRGTPYEFETTCGGIDPS